MDNEQEAFEVFALKQPGWSIEKFDGDYLWPSIKAALIAWQGCAKEKDAEILEQCRLNGMGSQRELALLAKIDVLERKIIVRSANQRNAKCAWSGALSVFYGREKMRNRNPSGVVPIMLAVLFLFIAAWSGIFFAIGWWFA